ncbi:unnamed protein product [Cochlearia groenlandica]
MTSLVKLSCLVILSCMIVSGPITSTAQISCGTVTNNVIPCLGYITQGGYLPPQCCNGVRNLNRLASTSNARQQACRCLQGAARSLGPNLNPGRAAGLPRACGVNIPYVISTSTNCATYVH